ncbi:DNA-3-methyladenine glycosylase I [Nitrosopumilus sp.]|uniref:DNA-3-methyladenine glycosylase I n=1 Tax=Nitrosopumilus sp. TaxID=2024843 RepID=UPI00262E3E62|nr:DNA-3-methyladenine glycosylase I [Nitrosopumilus sp.]
MKRCNWVYDEIHIKYHDKEWGVPLHNDRKLFEFLVLDSMQSGLSWKIVLNKRKSFKKSFDNFDPKKVACYSEKDVKRLLSDKGIIRNRRKIESAINNAKRFLEVKKEFKTFDRYIWSFTNYKTVKGNFRKWDDIPAVTKESQAMSADLRKRGFTFVGPTVCYAYMQTIGMANDHLVGCFRRNQI